MIRQLYLDIVNYAQATSTTPLGYCIFSGSLQFLYDLIKWTVPNKWLNDEIHDYRYEYWTHSKNLFLQWKSIKLVFVFNQILHSPLCGLCRFGLGTALRQFSMRVRTAWWLLSRYYTHPDVISSYVFHGLFNKWWCTGAKTVDQVPHSFVTLPLDCIGQC